MTFSTEYMFRSPLRLLSLLKSESLTEYSPSLLNLALLHRLLLKLAGTSSLEAQFCKVANLN